MRILLLATVLILPPAALAQQRLFSPTDLPSRAAAAQALGAILAKESDLPTTLAGATAAGKNLPEGSAARARLDNLVQSTAAAAPGETARRTLREGLGELVEVLTFRPLVQAPMPRDFPGFQVVDELELRDYPAYRMASTTMRGGSNAAFWPLFRHIESNGISMTTPVRMDWQPSDDGSARPQSMAFLYGERTTEPKQVAEGVRVVEVPACTVLSIGMIGDDRRERIAEMRARFDAFLAAHPEWRADGSLRTMGYNSPMVPRDRRYFEVQLPVRRVPPAPAPQSR